MMAKKHKTPRAQFIDALASEYKFPSLSAWVAKAGLGNGTLRNWAKSTTATLNMSTVAKLAEAAGMKPEDLVTRLRCADGASAAKVLRSLEIRAGAPPSDVDLEESGHISSSSVIKLLASLVGRGEPPITQEEVLALAGPEAKVVPLRPDGALVGGTDGGKTFQVPELDMRASNRLPNMADLRQHIAVRWGMPQYLLNGHATAEPSSVIIVPVFGDAMAPDFLPNERVLVDLSDRTPSPSGVFMFWDGKGHIIRRFEYMPYSDPPIYRVRAKSPDYSHYDLPGDGIMFDGRVIGKWLWT